jgi:hypothetical protein
MVRIRCHFSRSFTFRSSRSDPGAPVSRATFGPSSSLHAQQDVAMLRHRPHRRVQTLTGSEQLTNASAAHFFRQSVNHWSTDFGSFKNRNASPRHPSFLHAPFASSPHKLQQLLCHSGSLRRFKSGTRTKRRARRKDLQPFLLKDHCCDFSLKRSGPLGR